MKKILILTSIFSLSLAGTLYLGIDSAPEYEIEFSGNSMSDDMDGGGISIGYNHPVYQKDQMGFSLGASYMVSPMTLDGEDDDDEDTEVGFFSVYGLPTYSFNDKMMGWFSFGLNIPTHDADDADNGMTYGLGIHYKINDKLGAGLGYVVNTIDDDATWTFSKVSFFLGYAL